MKDMVKINGYSKINIRHTKNERQTLLKNRLYSWAKRARLSVRILQTITMILHSNSVPEDPPEWTETSKKYTQFHNQFSHSDYHVYVHADKHP